LALLLAAGPLCPSAAAQEKGQLDADPALFTVLAAINAAGYDADLDSAANHPLRQAVRDHLKARNIPSLADLKQFFETHKQLSPSAELSQYVSFALCIDGPPDFAYRYNPTELPPDVLPLDGLAPLLTAFYREAGIAVLWEKSQPAFDQVLEAYQAPVTRTVMQANGYLRNPTSGFLGRRFQIYIDLLAAPNQVHTRSYKDDYFIVLTPTPEPQTEEIRHAYLHYLLDPLVLKFAEALSRTRGFLDYAQAAPALEDYYKTDFTLFATECLVKAVEGRIAPGATRDGVIQQALREGFVLTPAFADALALYEKQEQALRLHFPEMVKAIDLGKEERRLANVEFARTRAVKKVKVVPAERTVELTGPHKALQDANTLYAERKLVEAKVAFSLLLQITDNRAIHSRAYYGLARIAALERDPELSVKLFRRALDLEPDAEVRSWSLVYLGRLFDAQNDREQAIQNYQAALTTEGVPTGARQAAEKGLKESFNRSK
jgi:tetratricopeptide (TPR) repeat protein